MSGDVYDYTSLLRTVLKSAKARDYSGYGKFDALNSPLLHRLSFGNKWLRLLYTQAVKNCPFNVRPLLGVVQSRNPKGIALFARALLFLHRRTGDPDCLREAEELLDWLIRNPSQNRDNLCWGYNFTWQSPLFLQEKNEPNVVVTIFAGEALVHAYRVTGKAGYMDAFRSVARFLVNDVPVLHRGEGERAIAYVPDGAGTVVLNINALAGAFLIKVWKETGDEGLAEVSRELVSYTVNRRTDYYAWYYTFPETRSPISHDNYHTGGILDALLEYREEAGDESFSEVYWNGLEFYRERLFEQDGAPRWMSDRRYPRDVHGAAQGITTFAKAGRHRSEYLEQALRIAEWTHRHLYRPATGDYAYRQGRFVKWNYTLMRWCNAWMARALGELVDVMG